MSEGTAETPPHSPAGLVYDGLWHYWGYHDCRSVCHLRLFAPEDKDTPLIAVFTELEANRGTSVTNRIEHLATWVWQWQERPERGLTIVEHYPNRGLHNKVADRWQFPEQFDLLAFTEFDGRKFAKPRWRRTSRITIEKMIAQKLLHVM